MLDTDLVWGILLILSQDTLCYLGKGRVIFNLKHVSIEIAIPNLSLVDLSISEIFKISVSNYEFTTK